MINNKKLIKILKRFPKDAITNVETISAYQNEKNEWTLKIKLSEKIQNGNEKNLDEIE